MELSITQDPINRIDLLNRLANIYTVSEPDQSLEYAHKAYELSKEEDYVDGLARSLVRLAQVYQLTAEYGKSINYADELINLAGRHNLIEKKIIALRIKGLDFHYLGDNELSHRYFYESLKLSEQIEYKLGIKGATNCIAYSYFNQKNHEKALEYYLQALALAREMGSRSDIASELNNIASQYISLGDYNQVENYLREAITINSELNNQFWLLINYINLGKYYKHLKLNDSVFYYYSKSLKIAENLENTAKVIRSYLLFSEFYMDIFEEEKGLAYAEKAFRLASENRILKEIYNSSILISSYYRRQGNPDSLLKYDTLRLILKDSLEVESRLSTLKLLEVQHEIEKVKLQKSIQTERERLILWYILGTLLTGVIIIGFLYYRRGTKAKLNLLKSKKLENELYEKNREIKVVVMSLMKRNELIISLSDKLLLLEQSVVHKANKKAILKIASDLKELTNEDVTKEFNLRFKEVNKMFYKNMTDKFPDLSPNELRLCAFLKFDMTTKEISQLTGQSINAIETARYRLRKKLAISNQQIDLRDFLRDFE